MNRKLHKFWLMTSLSLALALANHAVSAEYTYVDLAPRDQTNSRAYSINDHDQIVGISGYGQYFDIARATVWSEGTTTYLDRVGSSARDINNAGQITGSFYPSTTDSAIWDHGTKTSLSPNGEARAINESGQVVGYSGPLMRATTWIAGQPVDLGGLSGGRSSYAFDINNKGQIVGGADTGFGYSSTQHAVFWDNGTIIDISKDFGKSSRAWAINDAGQIVGAGVAPGATISRALYWASGYLAPVRLADLGSYSAGLAINERGDIVGYSYLQGTSESHALLWRDGVMTDLNSFLDQATWDAGWRLTTALAINNNGSIVGYATQNGTGLAHAFLLSAVPEPGALPLMLLGAGLMLVASARERGRRN